MAQDISCFQIVPGYLSQVCRYEVDSQLILKPEEAVSGLDLDFLLFSILSSD
jgi:hypothetical protein